MARRKLTIVVTCTDRKFAAPSADLMARSLPAADTRERVNAWVDRLNAAPRSTRLLDLYKGESWTQAKRLFTTANSVGFEPDLYVASAGLGLRSVSETAPTYAATFARGQQDSVVSTTADARLWWSHLPHTATVWAGAPSIWVLSESYAAAMHDELRFLDPNSALVFGGALGTPEDLRIRSNRDLRAALGGTVTSLNTRMAIRWLEMTGGDRPTSPTVRRNWDRWSRDAQKVERYNRRSLPDSAIRQLIQEMRDSHLTLSKTTALRKLRIAGVSCEQRRFSRLFEEDL